MADAKFMGGPLHGKRMMVPERDAVRIPVALPVHLRPTDAELADMPIHTYRYVRVDNLSDGSTLFMPEAKDERES